jgi:diacylglycerol kinase family enzyme
MQEGRQKKGRQQTRPTYGVLVNPQAANYSEKEIDRLITRLAREKANWHVIKTTVTREAIFQIKKLLQRRPAGIIACGGDGTVNLAARNLIRRYCALGIYPMGKFNNIYTSLLGNPNFGDAIEHIFSGKHVKVDYGVAGNKFFLGSVGFGLVPQIQDLLKDRRIPRFAIGWSRLASQAAAAVEPRRLSLTIDEFKFDITPLILNINLLRNSAGLPLAPLSLEGDGCGEVIFDPETGKAIISSFVRKIFKKKYLYGDEIRMYRGKNIIVTSVAGTKMYLDGENWEMKDAAVEIEIFSSKIRVCKKTGEKD